MATATSPSAAEEEEEPQQLTSAEQVNGFRRRLGIKVRGERVPAPAPEFAAMDFHPSVRTALLRNIEQSCWKEPSPVQMQAVPALLAGRDVLVAAPTGSGKTAAFALPLISKLAGSHKTGGIRALVLVPTKELADQIQREMARLSEGRSLKICLLKKNQIAGAVAKQDKALLAKYDVLISTPMRLLFLLRQELVGLEDVRTVVVDEVDKLFEADGEGKGAEGEEEQGLTRSSFLSQIDEVLARCAGAEVQRCLFSATVGPLVQELADGLLSDPVRVSVGTVNAGAASIDQRLVFVSNEEGKLLAVRQLVQAGLRPPVLVFVQSKARAEALLRELVYDGINVDCIHAERTQQQREKVIAGFRSGAIWVLVCTDLMARGVDFKGVRMVVNYDLPQTAVSYIHRIGRTGRAGMRGTAVTLFTEADVGRLRSIANVMRLSGCEVPDWMLGIKQLSTRERRSLRLRGPERRDISTEAVYDVQRRLKRKNVVQQSKRKKQRAAEAEQGASA